MPVKKLGKALAAKNFPAVGVTEVGNLFSAAELGKYVASAGIQPILGVELPVLAPPMDGQLGARQIGFLTLLVKNATGWASLARLVSESQMRKLGDDDAAVELARVVELNEGLIVLSGPFRQRQVGWAALGVQDGRLEAFLDPLRHGFGDRFYVQLERHGWPADSPQGRHDKVLEEALRGYAAATVAALVATNDTRFLKPEDVNAAEVLAAIGESSTMDDPNRPRFSPRQHLRTEEDMVAAFADIPSALANTVEIATRCAFLLSAVHVKQMYMPTWEFGGSAGPDMPVVEVIREEAAKGLAMRLETDVYPHCADEAARAAARARYDKQLDYELGIIISMGFEGYFLITSDFIRWAKRQGIPVGPGRGSGAGSLVAWSLQITDLDPMRWELYFERFLNPERVSLPDFDVDFCQDRRDEVIAYVRERYGADRVAHIITFGTLKARACLRDVGRVLGLGYGFVGQVAALIPEGANPPPIADVLAQDERLRARYDAEDDVRRLVDTALKLEGCYRHASTHAAGVIIADRPIATVCGLYVDPRSPMPVTQLAMSDAEYAGLVKFDFLGLKTLSVIRMAEDMVRAAHDPNFDVMRAPLDDAPTFTMLKHGHTLGVFQIEGSGITELTKKMQADDMESLSAILALYRPGPLGTGMVDDYVNCKLGKAEAKYPHPILKPALEVTYGVPVYQEQIMQMARDMAGYTLGGADMLRRAMGKKKPEEMAKERAKFMAGAATLHSIADTESSAIFDLMAGFAEYGFNKAHTIAYALISFQTAYLKAHYPAEFMAATMTYDRGNQDKLFKYKADMQAGGVGAPMPLLAPCVNRSGVMFVVEATEQGAAIRHALSALKGAGEDAMRRLVAERDAKGPYTDIWNLLERLGPQVMNRRQLEVLAKAGALDALDPNRAFIVANLDPLLAFAQAADDTRTSGQTSLFGGGDDGVDAAPYKASCKTVAPWAYLEKLQHEAEAVGFYLSSHPLDAFAADLARMGSLKPMAEIADFALNGGGVCRVVAIIHAIREVKTKSGNRMGVLTVSDSSGQGEIVLFPEAYAANALLHEQLNRPFVFTIKVAQDGERLRVNAESIVPLEATLAERPELVICVDNPSALPALQQLLQDAAKGMTLVKLKLPSPQGEATLRLPKRVGVSTPLLANLRNMEGVRLT